MWNEENKKTEIKLNNKIKGKLEISRRQEERRVEREKWKQMKEKKRYMQIVKKIREKKGKQGKIWEKFKYVDVKEKER